MYVATISSVATPSATPTPSKGRSLTTLPDDLLEQIVDYLDIDTRNKASQVDQQLRQIALSPKTIANFAPQADAIAKTLVAYPVIASAIAFGKMPDLWHLSLISHANSREEAVRVARYAALYTPQGKPPIAPAPRAFISYADNFRRLLSFEPLPENKDDQAWRSYSRLARGAIWMRANRVPHMHDESLVAWVNTARKNLLTAQAELQRQTSDANTPEAHAIGHALDACQCTDLTLSRAASNLHAEVLRSDSSLDAFGDI